MTTWCVWPDGTVCDMGSLESYLKFMSDDFLTCVTPDEDVDAVPSYDEIATYKRIYHDTEMAHKP